MIARCMPILFHPSRLLKGKRCQRSPTPQWHLVLHLLLTPIIYYYIGYIIKFPIFNQETIYQNTGLQHLVKWHLVDFLSMLSMGTEKECILIKGYNLLT